MSSSSQQQSRQNHHHHHHHRNNRRQEDDQEMIMPTLPTRNRVVVEHYKTTTVKKGAAAPPPSSSPMIMMQTPPPPPAMSDDDDDHDHDSGDNNDVEDNHRNNNNNDRGIPQVLQSTSTHSHKKKQAELKVTNTAADAKTACTTSTTISLCNNSLGATEYNNLTYQERIKHYNNTMGRPGPTNTVINKNPKTKSGKKAAAAQQQQQQQSVYTEGTRAKTIVPLLALQAYHLPGNNWCQDWRQYMTNNHPVFGICCHHPLHPIGACTRIIALIAYCIFGLAITNFFYLFLLLNPELNRDVITISFGNDDVDQTYVLTTGMLLLWTVGGSIHALYNLVIWHIAACVCCRTGGCCESIACCPSFGKRLVRVFLFISIILAVVIVLLRVGIAQQEEQLQDDEDMAAIEESVANNNTMTGGAGSSSSITINIFDDDSWDIDIAYEAQEFNFLIGYLVEMVLALFIYYPLGGTILFSGILGCGCIPLLGGRPAEVKAEKKKLEQQLRQKEQQQRSGGGIPRNSTADMNDLENCNNDGIELIFSPQAVREFDERR